MDKATPTDMRKALEAVDALKKAGILFVPMPVLNDKDHSELQTQLLTRMVKLEAALNCK
ncbi:MAG: DUF1382 family protein [Gammaproteobacteria bacterium]|nr:DUF1382 family protein [Gammaproteobacteria bacterium]